jgi:hypothetical protein
MIMPSGVWTDASGMACAPIPDSPKMNATTTSLFIVFSLRDVSPYFRSATGIGFGTLAVSGVLDGEWNATSKMNATARQ